jgi:hypothetical protein
VTAIDRTLMLNALGWLVAGTVFGFWMGASGELQLVTVHVAMLLPGFVTLAIYGLTYRLWPGLERAKLARLQGWLAVLSEPLLVAGAWHNVATGSILPIAPASAAAIAAAALMAWLFWRETLAA